MCGIVGIVGSIPAKMERVFGELLFIDTLRGADSTGVLSVSTTNHVYDKVAYEAPVFLQTKKYHKLVNQRASKLLLGHNRAATVGSVTPDNAHPFECGDLIGVHNGTLTSQLDLDPYDTQVDSERLYNHLANNSVQDTINKAHGAFALVWYNKKDRTVNFLRNSQRPFHYAFTKDKQTLVFASEWGQLVHMDDRHNLGLMEIHSLKELQHVKVGVPNTYAVPLQYSTKDYVKEAPEKQRGVSHSSVVPFTSKKVKKDSYNVMTDQATVAMYTMGEVIEFTLDSIETNKYSQRLAVGCTTDEYNAPVSVYLQQKPELEYLVGKDNTFKGSVNKEPTGTSLFVSPHSCKLMEEDVADTSTIIGFDGRLLSKDRASTLLNYGCCWCSDTVPVSKHGEVMWLSHDEYLCPACQEEEEVKVYLYVD
jgi:glucosamine 6-phosphate synthetase-like amidotransferase/phosphosugar isomerase protein